MDTSARDFRRFDEDDDSAFYSFPRRVVHIDDGAIAALTRLYAALVPAGVRVLDLMGSWRSHLPASFGGAAIGLGLNAVEMAENPHLAAAVVHDLNREPGLPFADAAFDAVVCAVSVQYLTRPLDVFREVRRVLRPGAPFVVSFSNRCFPDKAVALWRASDDSSTSRSSPPTSPTRRNRAAPGPRWRLSSTRRGGAIPSMPSGRGATPVTPPHSVRSWEALPRRSR